MEDAVMLKFEGVHTGYGSKEVIKGFTAEIHKGEFVGLIGSNGTGKSTLLKCLSGLLPITGGRIVVKGRDNAGLKQRERSQMVAVVPQSFDIDYDFTVEDIVLMGRNPYLSYRDRESVEDYRIVEQAMKMTKTLGFRGRMFNELSGGEKQRVIIARAIAQEPDIILLDEPTSALDVHHQIEVMELIDQLNKNDHMTVVAVLHDINLASRYCGRLIMIQGGRVVADGPPADVVIEQNLKQLYNMKMLVRENAVFEKPEIVPIRVLEGEEARNPLHIHVICGGSGASKVIEELDDMGHRVTAGVINEGSDDWLVCKSLNLDIVEERPFTTISMEKQQENLKLMQDADIVLIADVPFGLGNVNNLEGLEMLDAEIYLHANCLHNDFTEGRLEACLNKIREKKTVVEIGDHDAFLEMLQQR